MIVHLRRALTDIWENGFVSAVTFITIGLLVMMIGAFTLFIDNAGQIVNSWKQGVRLMAYLEPSVGEGAVVEIQKKIMNFHWVRSVRFISKMEALDSLRNQLQQGDLLLDSLEGNPLPDALEIKTGKETSENEPNFKSIESLAAEIEKLDGIEEVEYGQQWFRRFTTVFDLFRFIGLFMGGFFILAAVFIVANTIRLVIYTRRHELQVMRLVGAYNGFIKIPFYIQAVIQGAAGGVIGVASLYAGYRYVSALMEAEIALIQIRFLSLRMCAVILIASMFLGWFGCFLSLRRFLKV